MKLTLMKEFKEFINKGNVVDLAVALVMGTAFSRIVDQIVKGIIMPLASIFLPKGDWQKWTIWKLQAGSVLDAFIQFVVISFVIFIVLKKFLHHKKVEAVVSPPEDVLLLQDIRHELRELRALQKARDAAPQG